MFKSILTTLLLLTPLITNASEFVAGKDYVILKHVKTTNAQQNAEVHVTEFFSYGCPWCYQLEPELNKWVDQKKPTIFFNKVPVVFNKSWKQYAKAFYTAQALDIEPQLAPDLFKAILKEHQPLNDTQAMIDFFVKHGVDAQTAKSAFKYSPSIEMEVNDSKNKMVSYQINAVPALVVNERYKTDMQMAKTEKRLFEILDFLVNKAARDSEPYNDGST